MKIEFFVLGCMLFLKQLQAEDCVSNFRQTALKLHNTFRSIHGSLPLMESNQLMTSAQSHADFMSRNDLFRNSGQLPGENIFMISGVGLKDCNSKIFKINF